MKINNPNNEIDVSELDKLQSLVFIESYSKNYHNFPKNLTHLHMEYPYGEFEIHDLPISLISFKLRFNSDGDLKNALILPLKLQFLNVTTKANVDITNISELHYLKTACVSDKYHDQISKSCKLVVLFKKID